jgi:NhaP-type Na+/H+ or K+/H+ antiporter
LFDSLIKHFGDADVVGVATVHDTLREFIWVTLGSFVVGISCGFVCTFYFYGLQGKQSAVSEVAMFFLWSLIPYYIADGSGFSGIISIMVMGFMMDYFVVGGFQSEEGEWMEYMAMRHDDGPPVEPHLQRFRAACSRAFSGRGHISSRSRHHVGFVAEVIANLMETSIFAYLGLFLFNDTSFSFKLGMSALFSCISSRAAMVIIVSLLINFCVWIDLEGMLGRLWFLVRRQNSLNLDDDSLLNSERVYIDKKTQLILFSAGIRGAVSYALVQNIPVYDAVTKHGSHFKGELRAMTSSTIVVLLFSLGALTFFTVQQGIEEPERERTSGMLTHRLMGSELDSNIDPMDDLGSLALDEVDSQPLNPRPPTRT